ncbi:MAG TPA: T9SS type A sorting domain-containing protein [Bacteroidia bacterium]|jgi:PKD repeat protein/sugar lactone lactonase YvrE|nr:T9SS type A sorting domain-containing protein [Bacteroidia bacterium]
MKTIPSSAIPSRRKTITAGILISFLIIAFTGNAQVGIINTIGGNGIGGYTGDGGAATAAELLSPSGIALDTAGNLYIADYPNNRIRKITKATGIITTIAGTGNCCGNPGGYTGDGGQATAAEISRPYDVAVDKAGNVYIADGSNYCIRKITVSTGIITTITGNGTSGFTGDGGPATAAEISTPAGVAVDDSGNVYLSDCNNQRVRKISKATGFINTVAGNGTIGYSGDGGSATAAEFAYPYGLNVDASGNLYVPDINNNCIRKITKATGIITTIAGNGSVGFTGDGGPATSSELYNPSGVSVDVLGNVFISDQENHCIRKISKATGFISTVAGIGQNNGYTGDGGPATAAELFVPWAAVSDTAGNLYIADDGNNVIREVNYYYVPVVNFTAGSVTVCAGDSVHFTDLSTHNPTNWSWTFTGGSPATSAVQNPAIKYNTAGTYAVKLVASNLGGADSITKTLYIHVNARPTLSVSGNSFVCHGSDILTVSPSGKSPFTYAWNTGGTSDTIKVHAANIYSITVSDSNGCSATGNINISEDSVTGVDICFVTVDTASKHNIIVWNKSLLTNIDSIKIYFLDAASQWSLLGSQPFSAIGQYTDTAAINNPNANTVRYCITGVDSCGIEEKISSSLWQNTMYINQSPRGTFIWSGTSYLIENNPLPVLTYYLYRDSIANGNWVVIDSISGTQNKMSDPNYLSYPLARWYVSAKLNISGCPAAVFHREESSGSTISRSNQDGNVPSGINAINAYNSTISVYPNPAGQQLNIKFGDIPSGVQTITINDVTGRIIMEQRNDVNPSSILHLNISDFKAGIYFVKIASNNNLKVIKFIKE